jgi:hypothetical protein
MKRILLVIGLVLSFNVSAIEWVKYTNERYNFSIDYPSDIFDSSSIKLYVDEGLILMTRDKKVKFHVYIDKNHDSLSRHEIRRLLKLDMYDRDITYNRFKKGGIVFSGYMVDENQEKIFYQRTMINRTSGAFSTFEIIYPKNQRYIYDQMMERMSFSLTAPE